MAALEERDKSGCKIIDPVPYFPQCSVAVSGSGRIPLWPECRDFAKSRHFQP